MSCTDHLFDDDAWRIIGVTTSRLVRKMGVSWDEAFSSVTFTASRLAEWFDPDRGIAFANILGKFLEQPSIKEHSRFAFSPDPKPCGTIFSLIADRDRKPDGLDKDFWKAACRGLNPRQREMLLMKFADGQSYRTVAKHFGVTKQGIEDRIRKMLPTVRRNLTQAGYAEDNTWSL